LLEWIRKGVELFGTSGFQHACDEFCQEDQSLFQMETAPAPLQPDLSVLVQQLNGSSTCPPGSSAYQTTREIRAEIAEAERQTSTPEPGEYSLDAMWRIRAAIDTLHRIPTSRNRYIETDLEVILRDRFPVRAMARDPHAAGQTHEASGVPLAGFHARRDHLEVDATWRPWNHDVTRGTHNCRLNEMKEKPVEEA
jgi:hypothetical protein